MVEHEVETDLLIVHLDLELLFELGDARGRCGFGLAAVFTSLGDGAPERYVCVP